VSPSALAVEADSSKSAKYALRSIADTLRAPSLSGEKALSFSEVAYELIITNAGSPDAFSVAQTIARRLNVEPDSSASIRQEVLKAPRFVSRADRVHWLASGKRAYASPADRAGATTQSGIGAGGFSFAPEGAPVTFREARNLSTSPHRLIQELMGLSARGRMEPSAATSLRQYGFLLATAPLTPATRKALVEALGLLPGVHMCNALFPGRSPHADAFCVSGNPTDSEVLLNPRTGVVDVVAERLDRSNSLYPNMAVGSLIDSETFSMAPAGS
jgi:hypothetical protein